MSGNLTPWSSDSDSSSTSSSSSASPFDTTLPDKLNPNSWDSGNSVVADQSADDFEQAVENSIAETKEKVQNSISNNGNLAASNTDANDSYGTIQSSGAREAISNIDSKWRENTNAVDTQNDTRDVVDNAKITADQAGEQVMETAETVNSTVNDVQDDAKDVIVDKVTPGIPSLPGVPMPNLPDLTPSNEPAPDNSGGSESQLGKLVVVGGLVASGVYALTQRGGGGR